MSNFPIRQVLFIGLFLFCLAGSSSAQSGRHDVKGVVLDSLGMSLPGATVVALTRVDSVLTKFATTDGGGAFTLRRLSPGDYILQVTFVGYQTSRTNFSVASSDVDAGTITMQESVAGLSELVVSADHVPFVVKRDTLDYNADAFQTRANAMVEDLLRRLPGIEVEDDGSITAQGERVQKVLVEGKEFFGSDPTIATKNLPANAVQRVQVYDKQSDTAEFTGIPDGEEVRTINLKLKDNAKAGTFGRIAGGFGSEDGSDGRYDGELSINRFSRTSQLALIGNINNINRQGFAWGDFITFMGGMQGFARGGSSRGGGVQIGGDLNDGFSETLAVGINANHDFTPKSWVRTSYFLSSLNNTQDRTVKQQQLLGTDVSSLINQSSNQNSDNLSHNVNLNAQHEFAAGHDIRLRGNFSASNSTLLSLGFQETLDPRDMLVRNSAVTDYNTRGDNLGGDAQLTWRKRVNERGRSVFVMADANLKDADINSDLLNTIGSLDRANIFTYDEIQQAQSQLGKTFSHSQRVSMTEPLGSGHIMEVFAERSVIEEDQTKNVFDLLNGSSTLNDDLSSGFERTYSYLRGGLQYSRNTRAAWYSVGVNAQKSTLDGVVLDRDEEISNGYTHILPWMNLKLVPSDGKSINIRYRTSTREPSMTELQPFSDNSNPLSIYSGNPSLTPEYRHSLSGDYRFFDQFSFVNLFASASVNYTKNEIVIARTVTPEFLQLVTPINADAGWSSNMRLNFGTPIRSIGAKINISNNLSYSNGSEFINEIENESKLIRNIVDVSIENRLKDLFDIRVGSRLSINDLNYSLNESLSRNYLNSTYYLRGSWYIGETWTLSSELNYQKYDQEVFGPGNDLALLEASVSKMVLDGKAEILLSGRDLLNQYQGVNFTNASSYIQEERIESLGRYVMLKFIYRLSGVGSGGGFGRGK